MELLIPANWLEIGFRIPGREALLRHRAANYDQLRDQSVIDGGAVTYLRPELPGLRHLRTLEITLLDPRPRSVDGELRADRSGGLPRPL